MTSQPEDLETSAAPKVAEPPAKVAPLFHPLDWLVLAATGGVLWGVYLFTLAPEQTLQSSGELCTAAYYAGIPHPPGYPCWVVYSWFWTAILPFGNVAWRVEVGQSFACALGCGLLALMVSAGSRQIFSGMAAFAELPRRWEKAIGPVAGFTAGLLLGLDPLVWSGSVTVNQVTVFGVPWFLLVLTCLMRWMHAPQQRRYLYLTVFLFGLCATISEWLLLGGLGLAVAIALATPKLGRDLLLGTSLLYFSSLWLWNTVPVFWNMTSMERLLLHLLGMGSLLAGISLCIATRGIAKEWLSVAILGVVGIMGASFYLYEPVSAMTDPPMQWAYPRNVEGFFHSVSRGQYESIYGITTSDEFIFQVKYLAQGVAAAFNPIYALVGLLPLACLGKMPKQIRAWILSLVAIYFCLSMALAILIDVSPDRSSQESSAVFFAASHGVFALLIGYGLALLVAAMATHYQTLRKWGCFAGILAVVLAVYSLKEAAGKLYDGPAGEIDWSDLPRRVALAFAKDQYGLPIFAGLVLLAIFLGLTGGLLVCHRRAPMRILLGLVLILPLWSGMAHWEPSEQRNHWFGYWFGHDMFTPPFTDPQTGKLSYDHDLRARLLQDPTNAALIYPEMDRNTILFGGTDPGRFCATYAIFCDSFIPHRCQPDQDQKFDRRDCYIITQNALADGTYLEYIRAQYNRSQQHDPPFFSREFRYLTSLPHSNPRHPVIMEGTEMGSGDTGNPLIEGICHLLEVVLDRPFTAWGAHVEKYRRARGVYPPSEIYVPSPDDMQNCYMDYMQNANNNIPPYGQVGVMGVNALLCKVIFDHNPTNSFYVEESFPLDWMYPYEMPSGIIMKLNRAPQAELSDDVFRRDHQFWTQYSTRLCGNWITTYDTTVQQIADFVERTYLRHNYQGYTGDRAFARDGDAQRAFSKLRSSQAGMYFWRMSENCPAEYKQKTPAGEQALLRETEFALKQSFAFCPYSPEAVYRYVNFLTARAQQEAAGQPQLGIHYLADAILVGETCKKLDPYNESYNALIQQMKTYQRQMSEHDGIPKAGG